MKINICFKDRSPIYKNAAITAVLILLLAGCGTKYPFATSNVVPAAEGNVKVDKDGNSNYEIDLNVIRLASPARLNPAKEYYVVWVETADHGAKNIGQLKTSSGMFSSTLKSSLKTVTSFKPVNFFITAEDNASAQYPGDQVVLRTENR